MSIGGRVHIAAEVGAATAVRTMADGARLGKEQSPLLYRLLGVGDRVFLMLSLDGNDQVLRRVRQRGFSLGRLGVGRAT